MVTEHSRPLDKMYSVLRSLDGAGYPLDTGDAVGLPYAPFIENYRRHLGDPKAFKHYFDPRPPAEVEEGARRFAVHLGLISREVADGYDVVAGAGTLHLYEMILKTLIERPDDAILVPVPTYGLMIPQIKAAGGVPLFVEGKGHHPIEALEQAILDYRGKGRVVGLLHINPNTYGHVDGEQEVEALALLCQQHDITIIEDFAFFPLAARANPTPVVSALGRGCRAVALLGLSKPLGLANARLSLALAEHSMAESLLHGVLTSIGFLSRPLLRALGEVLSGDLAPLDSFLAANNRAYQHQRKVMLFGLEGHASTHLSEEDKQECAPLYPEEMRANGLSAWFELAHDPEWGMFTLVDCSRLLAQRPEFKTGMDVFRHLAVEHGVRSIPPEVMMTGRPELRLSYSPEPEVIAQALKTLHMALRNGR